MAIDEQARRDELHRQMEERRKLFKTDDERIDFNIGVGELAVENDRIQAALCNQTRLVSIGAIREGASPETPDSELNKLFHEAAAVDDQIWDVWRVINDLIRRALFYPEPGDDIFQLRDEAKAKIETDYEPIQKPIDALLARLNKVTDVDSLREELAEREDDEE